MPPVRGRRPGLPPTVRSAGSGVGASSRWPRCGPARRASSRRGGRSRPSGRPGRGQVRACTARPQVSVGAAASATTTGGFMPQPASAASMSRARRHFSRCVTSAGMRVRSMRTVSDAHSSGRNSRHAAGRKRCRRQETGHPHRHDRTRPRCDRHRREPVRERRRNPAPRPGQENLPDQSPRAGSTPASRTPLSSTAPASESTSKSSTETPEFAASTWSKGAGLSSEVLAGSCCTGASPETTRPCAPAPRP